MNRSAFTGLRFPADVITYGRHWTRSRLAVTRQEVHHVTLYRPVVAGRLDDNGSAALNMDRST